MAELDIQNDERPGILKEIDEGAMDLVFQAIQEDIYSFPIKSFIRESISNGLDAIVEKNIARQIKAGSPVTNYYRNKQDGKLLKDSEFNPEYYDDKYLSIDDKVYVKYQMDNPRDIISIKDYGVGLGGSRLKGFFKLGYSSKRNMKSVIGKFGAGAKAGLATGVDYFIMNTTYNGYKTSFMIFKNDYEAITVKSRTTKEEIWQVKMSNNTTHDKVIFWEKTSGKNSVEIILEVKKHNKKLFIDAVKDQFQYFNGKVHLTYDDTESSSIVDTLSEVPLYESDNLLIPKYSTYTTPHILVDGISYGIISWDELELETRRGKIAIKVKATDVDITQSRESLKWTEKTKKVILNALNVAEDEASTYIESLISVSDTNDLFSLNNTYSGISGDNPISSVFNRFLNKYNIRPKVRIKLGSNELVSSFTDDFFNFLFYNFRVKSVTLEHSAKGSKIKSSNVTSFDELTNAVIIHASNSSLGPRLAEHLLNKEFDCDSFIYIRARSDRDKNVLEFNKKDYKANEVDAFTVNLLKNYAKLDLDTYEALYDEPEGDEELDGAIATSVISTAKQRIANKEVMYMHYDIYNRREKTTLKIQDLKQHFSNFAYKNIVVATGKFKGLGKIIESMSLLFDNYGEVLVIYTSNENLHHFMPYGEAITDYFRKINTNTGELMVGEYIRKLNTLRLFRQIVDKYPDFAEKEHIVKAFTNVNFKTIESLYTSEARYDVKHILSERYEHSTEVLNDVLGYLEKLTEFQHIVSSKNKDDISSKALELFNSDKIYAVDSYDEESIKNLESEFERIGVISEIFALFDYSTTFNTKSIELLNLLITTKQKTNDDI